MENVIPIILSYFSGLLVPDCLGWAQDGLGSGSTPWHPDGPTMLGPDVSLGDQDGKPSPSGSREGFSCMFRVHLSGILLVLRPWCPPDLSASTCVNLRHSCVLPASSASSLGSIVARNGKERVPETPGVDEGNVRVMVRRRPKRGSTTQFPRGRTRITRNHRITAPYLN